MTIKYANVARVTVEYANVARMTVEYANVARVTIEYATVTRMTVEYANVAKMIIEYPNLAKVTFAYPNVASSDGPMIDFNRKSVGLGLLIATIDSKMQQSIVICSGTQSTCNWISHCYHAV